MNRILDINLRQWTTSHALLILIGSFGTLFTDSLIPLMIIALASFMFLIYLHRGRWTKHGHFGLANTITALRLILIAITAGLYDRIPSASIAAIGILILIADGLDGKIARVRGEISTFGEYFDKEIDAFFLHSWIMMAVMKTLLWPWTILLGLLRYIFVIYLFILGEKEKQERRFKFGRYIFVYVICAVLVAFLPLPFLHKPAIAIATVLLLFSFGRDFVWIHSKE